MEFGAYAEQSRTIQTPSGSATGIGKRLSLFWQFQITGWLAFAIMSIPLDWVVLPGVPSSAFTTVGRNLLGFCLTLGFRHIYRRFSGRKVPPLRIALVITTVSIVGGSLLTVGSIALHLIQASEALASFTPSVIFAIFYFRTAVCAGWSVLYFGIKMTREATARDIADARREAEKQRLEIQMLRAQMNPHFLFNALNTISASMSKPAQHPVELLQSLADYLRYSLRNRDADLVPFGEELDAISAYLAVEQARFRNELTVTSDVEPVVRVKLVPGIVLQPLLENAIKHGKKTSPLPLQIRIKIFRSTFETLRIEVWNTGRWLKPATPTDFGGVGLSNLRQRLVLLYADEQSVSISESNGWVCVTVEIPIPE